MAFAQCDYLAHGKDGMHDADGNEPALNFFPDVLCFDGITAIEKFAEHNGLRFSTARAVLATSMARTMRINLKGDPLDNVEGL